METTVTLPPDLAERLDALVASGAASDVVGALRVAVEAYETDDARKIEAVRAKIARALSDPRPSIPAEVVFDRLTTPIEKADRR